MPQFALTNLQVLTLQRIYERLVLKNQCAFLKTPLFTEGLQLLLLTVPGFQPASLLKKRLEGRRLSVNFAKFLKISFDRTPLGNCLFHLQVVEFQPAHTVQKYFASAFQAFYTRRRGSYSKTFMYLKSLKINKLIYNEVARYQPEN